MITKQISAMDASIYIASEEDLTDWEQSNKNISSEAIALLCIIGLGLFMIGFFSGSCFIIKCRKSSFAIKHGIMNDPTD